MDTNIANIDMENLTTEMVGWVNTTLAPRRVTHHKIWRKFQPPGEALNWFAEELVTKRYPHPNAPDWANIEVIEWDKPIKITDNSEEFSALVVQEHMLGVTNRLLSDLRNLLTP